MQPDSSLLIVRQTFQNRERETVADLRIERLAADGAPAPLTPEVLDQGLAAAAAYVNGTARLFAERWWGWPTPSRHGCGVRTSPGGG